MPRHPPCTLYSLISFMWVIFRRNCIFTFTLYGKTLKSHFSLLIIVSHYSIFKLQSLHSLNEVVGLSGLEPPTSRLSGVRSNRLSYKPIFVRVVSVVCLSFPRGGDEEDRTPDPLLARQVLSQLSYTPIWVSLFFSSESFQTLKIK